MRRLLRKLRRTLFNADPSFCDMYEDAHARQVADEYLRHITGALGGRKGLTILDAGCQAGRILIPLAQQGHRMTGIDRSVFAVRRVRRHAQELGLTVTLQRGDLSRLDTLVAPGSVDALICTEVLYLCQNFREILAQFRAALKPGGTACVSHRAAAYYLAKTILDRRPERLEELAARGEGPSPDGDYHNWQTPAQLQQLYHTLEFQVRACHPIETVPTPLALPADCPPAVRQLLGPIDVRPGLYAIPTYYLVIARRPA